MKTSFFTAMGLIALAGLGVAGPVAKDNNNRPGLQGSNNEETVRPGGGGSDSSQLDEAQSQKQDLIYCKAGTVGEIGEICSQCGGTPQQDPSCAPALQGCKNAQPGCFTDQKCQEKYGQLAKVQQCGKQSTEGLQNNQLLNTNLNQGLPNGQLQQLGSGSNGEG